MTRPSTFTCACGVVAEQSKRRILRSRCPDCVRKDKVIYVAEYYKRKKLGTTTETESSAITTGDPGVGE